MFLSNPRRARCCSPRVVILMAALGDLTIYDNAQSVLGARR